MPAGGIPFGHFHLHRRLARGGMAEVFLARQRGLEGFDRRVAVKRILPHLSERADFVKMFLDEARLAARLSHPNIVHIYEFGKVDADYFIAMEYVEGVHAGQLIKRASEEALPPVLVARIGADAASALAYAHRLEDADGSALAVVHRDISPQNLMISYDGVVKLVDFGIAKAAAAGDETQPGVVKGKYAYMSPEQTVGKPLDGRSDVFSLAVVLWEMLAGRYIVDRKDPVEAMRSIRDGRFPAIEEIKPDVPAPLAAALGNALEVDRDDRATAAELGVALESFIKSSPEMATPLQLAEWIRLRFPRSPTQSNPVAAIPARNVPPPTRAVTRATEIASVASPPAGAPAVALPPREATILRTAIPEAQIATDATLDLDDDDHAELTTPAGRAPTHLPQTEDTALVTSQRVPPPGSRERSLAPWLAVGLVLVATLLVMAWGAGVFRSGAVEERAPDAGAVVIALPPDAAPSVVAIAPDAPPPVDAAPALASLDVITTPPKATVRLTGRSAPAQRSPAHFQDLDPGPITVEVELKGHAPLTRDLDLAPGERRTIDLTLAKAERSAPPPRDRKASPGTLNVRTTPYSIVYDGAKKLGETPFVKRLPAGTYTLRFVNPDKKPVTRRVVIKAGETTKLNFDL